MRSDPGERVGAPSNFHERRKELEALVSKLHHDLCERGLSVTTADGTAASDQEAVVDGLARKLNSGLESLPGRTSPRTLVGTVMQVAAARLFIFASLGARLSANERRSLAALLRLPEAERRTLGTLLLLPGEERRELERVLSLSNLECQVFAAFIGDQQAEPSQESGTPKPRKPAGVG